MQPRRHQARRGGIAVALLCLLLDFAAGDAYARKYRVGDSIEITTETLLRLWKEPGDETLAPDQVLELGTDNSFDVEGIEKIAQHRWLKVRVFVRIVGEGFERYKTLGRGWLPQTALEGSTKRESGNWSSGMAAKTPVKTKAPPASPAGAKPRLSKHVRPLTKAAKAAAAEIEALPEGPELTAEECTKLAEHFKQLTGGVKSANAVPQGARVGLMVQTASALSEDKAKLLGRSFVSLFRAYKYHYLIYVVDQNGKPIVNGKQEATGSEIVW